MILADRPHTLCIVSCALRIRLKVYVKYAIEYDDSSFEGVQMRNLPFLLLTRPLRRWKATETQAVGFKSLVRLVS